MWFLRVGYLCHCRLRAEISVLRLCFGRDDWLSNGSPQTNIELNSKTGAVSHGEPTEHPKVSVCVFEREGFFNMVKMANPVNQ